MKNFNIHIPLTHEPTAATGSMEHASFDKQQYGTHAPDGTTQAQYNDFNDIWEQIQPGSNVMPDWTFTDPDLDHIMSQA